MPQLSSLAWYGIFVGINGTTLLGLVVVTLCTTPWGERFWLDVENDSKPHCAFLNGISSIASITAKPAMQILDWWSDVALMIEMKNSACPEAERPLLEHVVLDFSSDCFSCICVF